MWFIYLQINLSNTTDKIKAEVLTDNFDGIVIADGSSLYGEGKIGSKTSNHIIAINSNVITTGAMEVKTRILELLYIYFNAFPGRNRQFKTEIENSVVVCCFANNIIEHAPIITLFGVCSAWTKGGKCFTSAR